MKTPGLSRRCGKSLAACTLSLGLLELGAFASTGALSAAPPVPSSPVAASQAAAAEDIRDIRPPFHLAPAWPWAYWTADALAIAAVGYGVWRILRRRIRAKLPYELALERLECARELMHPEQARAFSILVSEVVRSFIEDSFAVRAAHRTTDEFLHELVTESATPLADHCAALDGFLRHCDLAKFARWVLSAPQMEAMFQSAAHFIIAVGRPAESADAAPEAVRPHGVPSSAAQ